MLAAARGFRTVSVQVAAVVLTVAVAGALAACTARVPSEQPPSGRSGGAAVPPASASATWLMSPTSATAGPDAGSPAASATSSAVEQPVSSTPAVTPAAAQQTPVTVLEIGDSLGEDLGFGLRDLLRGNPDVRLVQGAQGDSGLVQPQFYDWPRQLDRLLSQYHPAIVVVFIGANDVQNLYEQGSFERFGTPAWQAIYRERVDTLMQETADAGAQLLWVGMPVMRSASFSTAMRQLNDIYQAQAAAHPHVTYFPSWQVLATSTGDYTSTVIGRDGRTIVTRTPDGVHITFGAGGGGADILARAVVGEMRALYRLPDDAATG